MVTAVNPEDRIREIERTLGSLRDDTEVAHVLLGLAAALAEVRSVEDTLAMAVRTIPELLGGSRSFAASLDATKASWSIMAHWGYDDARLEYLLKIAREDFMPVTRAALASRRPVIVPDALHDEILPPDEGQRRGMGAYVGIPLSRRGADFGGIGVEFDETREFTAKDEALIRGIARQMGVALANARQFNLLQILGTFGLEVASHLRLNKVVEVVAAGAQKLLSGEQAVVYFIDGGRSRLVAAGSESGSIQGPAEIELEKSPWRELLQGRTIVIRDEDQSVLAGGSFDSAVAVPIPGQQTITGAILISFDRSVVLHAEETEALGVFAAQSAMAIANAESYERQRGVARRLQAGLVATEMPEIEGYEADAVYAPASDESEIGGDFFDMFDLPDGAVAFVVGDVSGKGAEAAAQTAMAKYMLRAFAMRNSSPSSVLFHLNNALVRSFQEDKFATLLYGVITPGMDSCSIASAGHPGPLLYSAESKEVHPIEVQGSILGLFAEEDYASVAFDLQAGDVLVAYTDGLVEARRGNEFYELDRLINLVTELAPDLSAPELSRSIYEDARRFGQVNDDTVVFTLSRAGKGSSA